MKTQFMILTLLILSIATFSQAETNCESVALRINKYTAALDNDLKLSNPLIQKITIYSRAKYYASETIAYCSTFRQKDYCVKINNDNQLKQCKIIGSENMSFIF